MSGGMTVQEILAKLEARVAFHEEKETFHGQQEEHHREQRAFHTAELQQVKLHLEAFKATAEVASELARKAEGPARPVDDTDLGKRPKVSHMIAKVLAGLEDGEAFGARWVTAEVNRRFGGKLRRPVSPRTVSVTLRRMRDAKRIHALREGKAFNESLYRKGARGAA
ncbi:MAG TPA: hypothetical protein VG477_12540 [Thermoanaerobaculia bacterium]|nr:hypothetical protein [Thermoanaerobaculia bacterium]